MNVRASMPGRGATPDALADVARIDALWSACLEASGGPFLFGEFGIADAMYAPVVMRFNTYAPGGPVAGSGRLCGARDGAAGRAALDRCRAPRNERDRRIRASAMNIYAVGGAIRDELLGVPVQDRDYVVVGATPSRWPRRVQAGRQGLPGIPASAHAGVRARAPSAKTAAGYHGFQFHYAPDVTLDEDLARRDLTINAMAREVAEGEIVGL